MDRGGSAECRISKTFPRYDRWYFSPGSLFIWPGNCELTRLITKWFCQAFGGVKCRVSEIYLLLWLQNFQIYKDLIGEHRTMCMTGTCFRRCSWDELGFMHFVNAGNITFLRGLNFGYQLEAILTTLETRTRTCFLHKPCQAVLHSFNIQSNPQLSTRNSAGKSNQWTKPLPTSCVLVIHPINK